jgi:hypothetical protein
MIGEMILAHCLEIKNTALKKFMELFLETIHKVQ